MSVIDRWLGRGPHVAARALVAEAGAAAPDLAIALNVDDARGRGAALLLAKLCFDRAAAPRPDHGHASLSVVTRASAVLFPAIAEALALDIPAAGRLYIDVADAIRVRLDERPPSIGGAAIVAAELRRAVGADASVPASAELVARVDGLIKQLSGVAARELGTSRRAARGSVGVTHEA